MTAPRRLAMVALCIAALLLASAGCIAAEPSGPRTVTDATGAEVVLPQEVNRIVSIDPMASHIILMLGGGDRLVGATFGPANRTVVDEICRKVSGIPAPGSPKGSNIEEIVRLAPDLVVARGSSAKEAGQIADAGIPVIMIETESPEDFLSAVGIIGAAIGAEERAADYVACYRETEERLRAAHAAALQKNVYLAGSGILKTAGAGWYSDALLASGGCRNVAHNEISGGWREVSPEQVCAWNPDMIILTPYCQDETASIRNSSTLGHLDAVKNGEIYRMPRYIAAWDMPVPESILGMLWIGSVSAPDGAGIDMHDEVQEFYARWYEADLDDATIEAILTEESILPTEKTAAKEE